MESGSTVRTRASRFGIRVVALTLFGILLSAGAGGTRSTSLQASGAVAPRSANGNVAIDAVTGYPIGSVQDQEIRMLLEQSSYEGGGMVVEVLDPITGLLIGSSDDQRLLELLEQWGYEGGGTVVRATS